jgi:hypothetical protein
VPTDGSGKKVDAASLDVGADTVFRQRIVLADNAATQEFATITGGILQVGGNVNLSATATVAGVVGLTAGTANIGSINHISRTVEVTVSTPFTVNNISRTVSVVCATPFILQGISTTVNVAVATPFTVNNISATVAAVLGAGAANIGSINNISATVTVAGNVNISATATVVLGSVADFTAGSAVRVGDSANGALRVNIVAGGLASQVSLAAGTANIGILNNISATVQVAIGTPFTVNNISATVAAVLGAGAANIGSINNISATVTVAGVVGLTAGAANIGHLNHISRTVEVAISTPITVNNISATVMIAVAGYTPATVAVMSASHGPKCVTASTSANVTLVASPGAGLFVYITQIMVGNNSSTKTLARIGTSASISTVVQPLAADGGGFVFNFDPPWRVSASEAAVCSVKPNVSQVYFTVNFYVGS